MGMYTSLKFKEDKNMIDYIIKNLSDDEIGTRLNEIERKTHRFGANVNELEKEKETLISELERRGYTTVYINC